MDSVRIHHIDIPFRQVLSHFIRWLLFGIFVGCLSVNALHGYFLWPVFGYEEDWETLLPHVISHIIGLLFLFIIPFFFVKWGYLRFKTPLEAAIKERCQLEKLKHSRVKAIHERRWKHFIKIIGDKAELIEKRIITDESTIKKCSNCHKQVHVLSRPGERCPNCGFVWKYEKNSSRRL